MKRKSGHYKVPVKTPRLSAREQRDLVDKEEGRIRVDVWK